jgi:hypothetical protein
VLNPDGLAFVSGLKSHRDWAMNRALNAEKKHGVDLGTDFESFSQLESQGLRGKRLSQPPTDPRLTLRGARTTDFVKSHGSSLHAYAGVKCCGGELAVEKSSVCESHPEQMRSVADRVAAGMGRLGPYKYPVRTVEAKASALGFAFKEAGLGLGAWGGRRGLTLTDLARFWRRAQPSPWTRTRRIRCRR